MLQQMPEARFVLWITAAPTQPLLPEQPPPVAIPKQGLESCSLEKEQGKIHLPLVSMSLLKTSMPG